jgi:hypothetical protein
MRARLVLRVISSDPITPIPAETVAEMPSGASIPK